MFQKFDSHSTTFREKQCLRPHLAAEIVVGHVQSEERLQAWRFWVAVLQEEPVLLRAEECHHRHVHLSRRKARVYFAFSPNNSGSQKPPLSISTLRSSLYRICDTSR